ncbi:hypothetical protein [Acinetobacter sp. YH16031]|nr:hypothetical protein [Acinetobacter sp. YH16031]
MQKHVIQNPMFDSKSLKLMYEQLCRDYAYASEIASMSGAAFETLWATT